MNWIFYTIIYALFLGIYDLSKKKAVLKNSIYEVLFFFSLISFVITIFISNDVFNLSLKYYFIIFIKSVIIVLGWIINTYVIDKMDLGIYGITKLFKIVFTVILSIIIFSEIITFKIFIGIILTVLGIFLANIIVENKTPRKTSLKLILLLIFFCFLSSISAIIDKAILKEITVSQLQFWFLLFSTIIYFIILIIKNKNVDVKKSLKNYWIVIAAFCLTIGDRLLFKANSIPESKVSVMTVLKQLSIIELIILGKFFFKEENLLKKLACLSLVIIGIIIMII